MLALSSRPDINNTYIVRMDDISSRNKNTNTRSTLFSRGKRTRVFFTSDSHRYLTQAERDALARGIRRYERTGQFDSVQMRFMRPERSAGELLYRRLRDEWSGMRGLFGHLPELVSAHVSPMRVWNASIIGAMLFGMFSMTMIYRYLGQQASAENVAMPNVSPIVAQETVSEKDTVSVAEKREKEAVASEVSKNNASLDAIVQEIPRDTKKELFEAKIRDMVKGYPIEVMLPYILAQDRDVATFLVSIAKKESNWGKRVPVLNGHDCYNYWGYRGVRDKMGTGGHTCFDNPQDAVETVAKRLKKLVREEKMDTPKELVVWKCGYSCSGHSKESVRKWISDVDMYVQALK